MSPVHVATRSVVTAVLAALVAVAGYFGDLPVAVLAGVLALVFALGWPALLDLPYPPGSSAVVALGGIGGVVAVHSAIEQPFLRFLPVVFAGAILLAFINEMLRRDGRPGLVESVSGTVAGTLVAISVAGWVATGRTPGGEGLVVTGALALAVAAAASVLRLPPWTRAIVTALAGAAAGTLGALALPSVDRVAGAVLGLAVGVLMASLSTLFHRVPALERRTPALAAVTLPVTVTGIVVYVAGRVLVG
ncbi:hypothetical protein ACTHAM_001644 [Cellulomonas soli]|uniref:hypothetical protein n=1 Tax=Cellulomonas soli TaxID=931535 RepID=UPI003F827A6C